MLIEKNTILKRGTKEWEKIVLRVHNEPTVINKLKELHLEKDNFLGQLIKEAENKKGEECAWVKLRKIQQLILTIRYLQNDGDATKECTYEKDPKNHCQNLVGVIDGSFREGGTPDGELDEAKQKPLYIKRDGTDGEKDYRFTEGRIEENCKDTRTSVWLGEHFYLTRYPGWTDRKPESFLEAVKNGEATLLADLEIKERFEVLLRHFGLKEGVIGLEISEKKLVNLIKEELGKSETIQQWKDKLKEIDSSLDDAIINDDWKDKWVKLNKFKKVDKVKSLFEKVKDKADLSTELPKISGDNSLVSLKGLAEKEPEQVITYICRYELNHLPDTDPDEKKKELTQMKRRIAKQRGKAKVDDLTSSEINETLYQDAIGKKVIDRTKFYDASLKEIKSEIPTPTPQEEDGNGKPFLRWDNAWLYVIGLLAIIVIGVIIFWDKLVNLFSGDKEENN